MEKVYAYFLELSGESGIVNSWVECQTKTRGVKKARYQSFPNEIEAKKWLEEGAHYKRKARTPKEKAIKKKIKIDLEEAVYFDAGTGRGIGVEIRVTDCEGKSLLKEKINEFGNIALGFSKTNNYGELLALAYAIEIALEKRVFKIYGDSNLVLEFWSQGRFHAEKLEEETVLLIKEVIEKRKYFEGMGGKISYIPGDVNPADLGFHKG